MTARLKLVQAEGPTDITRELRKEIEARDWSAMHIAADRRRPIDLPERVRRLWR